jgi:hypothetical protein
MSVRLSASGMTTDIYVCLFDSFWSCLIILFWRERESIYLPLTGEMLLAMWHYSVIHHGTCERSSSLLVTRVPVAPQGLGSTPRVGANLSRYNGVCAFSGRRCSRRQWGARGDFVNLEDLSFQSSKMFLRVGFACVFIGMNIRALWVHAMYCVIRKKNHHGTCYSAAGQMLILRWCSQFLPLREWRQRTSVLQPELIIALRLTRMIIAPPMSAARLRSQRPCFTARLPFLFLVKLVKLLKSAGWFYFTLA